MRDGHVRMGIAEQLRTIDDGFKIVASFPELKAKPIVIGESDPEGCAACQGPQLAYRNGTMYSSYTAAVFARKHDLAARHGVNLEGALTWAFEFEDQPYFAGFRSLATNGIDKPVLNVFRMFAKMSGERLAVESDGAVSLDAMMRAWRPREAGRLGVCQPRRRQAVRDALALSRRRPAGPAGRGRFDARELAGRHRHRARSSTFSIDADHSNAYTAWQRMGSPQHPTPEQSAELERAGQLAHGEPIEPVPIQAGAATLQLLLPRQAVSLLVIQVDHGD